ncbi:MAG: hypothetical protein MZV70_13410 [Desulfobacterales bacterium]|nr:hypothetical protein [Desulfobacterales bacterium]
MAEADDLVAIYMSSHGTPPDKFGGVHIVTHDTEVKPRERVWRTSVTESMLRDFIENLRAKRLVVILDTCYSNGAYSRGPGISSARRQIPRRRRGRGVRRIARIWEEALRVERHRRRG